MNGSHHASTIAALATAPAPAGVAIIRISGPKAHAVVRELFRGSKDPIERPSTLCYGSILDYHSNAVLDKGMIVFMPGPHSFTGEDIAEFQFHGSPLIAEKILGSLFSFGVSPAEPGEFTKRAFLNGKLDLLQAEAIADIIAATHDKALTLATEQLQGKLSKAIDEIGEPLRDSLAEIEASIDFPEEDIEPESVKEIRGRIDRSRLKIEYLLGTFHLGERIRDGYKVLICGKPNAGKSSLFNHLLGFQRAIVTNISGTTRDLLEGDAVFGGHRFILCDTAGFNELSSDEVEQIGIARAKEKVKWADVVLLTVDASDEDKGWQQSLSEISSENSNIWLVVNKIDQNPGAIGQIFCDSNVCHRNFYISAERGDGIEQLIGALIEEASTHKGQSLEGGISALITRERHRIALERALAALEVLTAPAGSTLPLEIMSAELRTALKALEELVGKTYTEDILGRIFSKFCVGK